MTSLLLSTIDQSATRSYIRYALVFACEPALSAVASQRLQRAVGKIISEIPVLSGTVKANGRNALEVTTSLQHIETFAAKATWARDPQLTLASLCAESVPPARLNGEALTPLPDTAECSTGPVCTFQANFVQGGLILVIYLHPAVGDIKGISSILRAMSEDLPVRRLTRKELAEELAEASGSRSRLSSGAGAPAFLAQARKIRQQQEQQQQQQQQQQHQQQQGLETGTDTAPIFPHATTKAAILSFELQRLQDITEAINLRRSMRRSGNQKPIKTEEVLVAFVWRLVIRARYPSGSTYALHNTSISLPIDIRGSLSPPLERDYIGNATMTAFANHNVDSLSLYYDITTIEQTATIIAKAKASAASDLLIRAGIEMLNQDTEKAASQAEADLKIIDWTESHPKLEYNQLDLGLGLGEPLCVRRIGRNAGSDECVLMPGGRDTWEVQLELEEAVMNNVLGDERLGWFLRMWAI